MMRSKCKQNLFTKNAAVQLWTNFSAGVPQSIARRTAPQKSSPLMDKWLRHIAHIGADQQSRALDQRALRVKRKEPRVARLTVGCDASNPVR